VSTRAAQPAKFLIVGAGGYLINLGIFAGFYELEMPYAVNSVLSYFISNAFMYLGNRYFTFGLGHDGFWGAYLRYMLVGALVAGAVVGLLAALVDVAEIDARLGQAIALLAVTPIAFVLFKRWTFRLA
jgi:putative flippase GtrA